jgi:micrococcal nuclease
MRKDLIMILGIGIPVGIFMILIGGGGHSPINFEENTMEKPKQIEPTISQPTTIQSETNCDESYPDVCITPYPPDLNCGDIIFANFRVIGSDPHGFDRDRDGIGCES